MFTLAALQNDTFNWQAALSLAFASKLAYEPSSTVENVTRRSWGFAHHVILDRGETQGFIAVAEGVALLAFRGTESLGDWLGNLNVLPEARAYGSVHSGFMSAYRLVEADIRAALPAPMLDSRKLWLTGHSLGGALATIVAAELHRSMKVAGIYTYGQPRLGSAAVRAFFDANYRDRFWRFVNDRDLISRVPPGYEHVGQLVHFNANGNVELPVTETATLDAEPPPFTPEQYEELRAEIKKYQSELRSQGRSEREAVLDATIEGRFPSLSDHRLERYIAAIQRQTGRASVDSAVTVEMANRAANEAIEAAGGPTAPRRRDEPLPVLIRLKQVTWTPPQGLEIGSRIGRLLSARAPSDVLRLLEVDPDVDRIELSRETGRPELVASVQFVGGDVVHRPPLAERGDQALVGLIDSGMDVLHEAFRNDQGLTRILGVWDQRENAGPSPNALDATHFSQTTGTLYLASDINDFIAGRPTPPGLRDTDLHGTHVASIAAGRAARSLADGMAPDAGIVVVIAKMKTSPGDPFSIGYSKSHFDGLAFLKAVSDGGTVVNPAPRPMAVNVSLGMNAGAHDGSSLLEASFDAITTQGQTPGFVIVKSAGNERGFGGHARFQAYHGVMPVEWESDNKFRFQDYFEVWYQALDELEFTLVDPAGRSSALVSRTNKNVSQTLGGNLCHFVLEEFCKDNGDNRLTITITPQSSQIQSGMWTLNVKGVLVNSRSAQVDIWVERDDTSRAVRFKPEVPETTLSIPGTANTVITVAACYTSPPLQPTPQSSFGLTRKGLPKPDITAPGLNIVAAKAGEADLRATIAMTGTSMAAPHVTGALALVLSCRHKKSALQQHNARQLLAAITRTAKFRSLHNPAVGHGMLDAEALYQLLK